MKKKIIPTKELLADMAALEIYGGIGSGKGTNQNCPNNDCTFAPCTNGNCPSWLKCYNCAQEFATGCTQPT